ncbi:MAG TPA: ClbS/DfsB family four-helix bundle protein [Chloroflexia bacterium]|jgi:hypothetical protein
MDQPLTKKQLIDTMRVERARWEMLLLRVGPGRMSVPVHGAEWTVGAVLGALYERERWLVSQLASIQVVAAPMPGKPSPQNDLNIHVHVVEASRHAFNEILQLLIPLSEADLFEPGRYTWAHGRTLAEVVSACTISYYVRHDPQIRSWLAQPVAQAAV